MKATALLIFALMMMPTFAAACSVVDPNNMGCKPNEKFSTFTCKCEPDHNSAEQSSNTLVAPQPQPAIVGPAQADDPAVPGIRWGSRIVAIETDKVTVKLMMATGNCVSPPMECSNTQSTTEDEMNFSSSCTSGSSKYGTAGEQYVLTITNGESYQVGRDVDVWIGDTGPSFSLPACITADW